MKTYKPLLVLLLLTFLLTGLIITLAAPSTDYEATLKAKIDSELARGAKLIITAKRSSTPTTTTITGTVTNISTTTLTGLVINGMTLKDHGETGFHYSILDIFNEDKISLNSLAPDATFNFSFTISNINWVANKIHGVIFVQDQESEIKEVLQALFIE